MNAHSARDFAIHAHGGQLYGTRPYVVHLDAVAELAAPFGEVARCAAYLHDVVEDTEVPLDQVREVFGELVATCVELVTDAPGTTRKERKAKTYAKLALVSGPAELALVVKTADRLANVRACVADDKRDLWAMYQGEQAVFRAAVYRPSLCDALWAELDALTRAWPQ